MAYETLDPDEYARELAERGASQEDIESALEDLEQRR